MQLAALWDFLKQKEFSKFLLLMKMTALFLLITAMQVSANGFSQQVTLSMKNVPVQKVLREINRQTGYEFFYKDNLLNKAGKVSIDVKNAPVAEVLSICFSDLPVTYSIIDKTIVVKEKAVTDETQPLPPPIPVIDVSGIVTDNKGAPLSGASVVVKGTQQGTSTDGSGHFLLRAVDEKATLVISFVGFNSQSVALNSRRSLTIQLEQAPDPLNETVVIGYGTSSRRDLTGAVSSINGEQINDLPAFLFDAALTGRAPGVQVVKSSGAPGAVASIRIRGGTSAIGNNEPLYVIDGVPIELGDGFGNAAYQNDIRYKMSPIANLNPDDIESIDILKDASSAAIYGSRAANGVVIITTKSGRKSGSGGPAISFGYSNSFDRFANNKYTMLDADQYHQVVKEAYVNAGTSLPSNYIAYQNASTDWVDLTTRTASSNDLYLNVGGSTVDGATVYSLSGGLTKQDGVIRFTDFERKNLRTSLETTLFNKLRFGTKINYSATNNSGSGTGQFYTIMKYRPDVPLYDDKGNFGASPDSVNSNPYARSSQLSEIDNQGLLMSFYGDVEILKGLRIRTSISSNQNKGNNVRYTPSTDVFEIRNGRRGSRNDYIYSSSSTIFDNTLTFNRRFNRHMLNLLSGASFTRVNNDYTNLSSTNFQDDNVLNNLGSAGSIQTYSSGGSISGLTSYFLRSNYNYSGKYYLTFTGRADHSTKFGPENRWGFFPSGALAWKISNEEFMRDIRSVNELKLRVSYGKTGSANFSDFQYATFFGSGSFYNNNNGVIANTVPNPDIRWESTYQFDAAADFTLFNNKLYGSLGYFQKTTRDMILNRQIIRETGGTNQYANMGDFLNRGWELQIGSEFVQSKDVSFTSDLNITRYRSKVLKLNNGSYLNLREGQPIGYFDGYKLSGIFQSQSEIDALNAQSPTGIYQSKNTRPGDFKFVDVNGDGFVGQADITILGKAEPDFYGGWNNSFRYKNFQLNAFFNFSVGNSLYNQGKRDLVFFTTNASNYSVDLLNAWTPGKTVSTLPRVVVNDPNNNRRDSDFFIEDASYFKLKNIQLSYLFKGGLLQKVAIRNVRTYVTLTNAFVLTGYSGLDPEVNSAPSNNFSQGIDSNTYPQTRTVTLGLNVNF
ncbi:MAG: TonB-dependent receptor [Flavisolibacter sp.]